MKSNYDLVQAYNSVDKSDGEDEKSVRLQSDILDFMFKNTLTDENKDALLDLDCTFKSRIVEFDADEDDSEIFFSEKTASEFIKEPLPVLTREQEAVGSKIFTYKILLNSIMTMILILCL